MRRSVAAKKVFSWPLVAALIALGTLAPSANSWRLLGQEASPKKSSSEQSDAVSDPLVEVNGESYSLGDFQEFLLVREGPRKVAEFIDHILLQREARRLRVSLDYQAIESELEARMARLEKLFQGDGLSDSLFQRHLSLPEYRRWVRSQVLWDLVERECILKQRKIPEQRVRDEFRARYGPESVALELRHVLVAPRTARTPVGAFRVCNEIMAAVRGGADFAELAKTRSKHDATAADGGKLPYRPRMWGESFDRGVAELSASEEMAIVSSEIGLHVVQLLERKKVSFEDEREILEEQLLRAKVTSPERVAFYAGLREQSNVEVKKLDGILRDLPR